MKSSAQRMNALLKVREAELEAAVSRLLEKRTGLLEGLAKLKKLESEKKKAASEIYENAEGAGNRFELRPWQGIQADWPRIGGLKFVHLFRAEQRVNHLFEDDITEFELSESLVLEQVSNIEEWWSIGNGVREVSLSHRGHNSNIRILNVLQSIEGRIGYAAQRIMAESKLEIQKK